ncbi:PKHA6 protein, partial [Polypterus senegalus]
MTSNRNVEQLYLIISCSVLYTVLVLSTDPDTPCPTISCEYLCFCNPQPSRSSRKAATFGKRSNSMRRNPKAEVNKQGWLYKQASSGVKQWSKRWFVLTDRCLFYYKESTLSSRTVVRCMHTGAVLIPTTFSRHFLYPFIS